MLARDGEGATKFVRVICEAASSDQDAHAIANTVALSPLVKTALAASDPNWGRIVAAVGRAPISQIAIDRVNVWINDVQIVENGVRHPKYTEQAGQAAMNPVISISDFNGCWIRVLSSHDLRSHQRLCSDQCRIPYLKSKLPVR